MNHKCALCGHEMTLATCGSAGVFYPDGEQLYLCHADDHDCYHAWTVYGARPVVDWQRINAEQAKVSVEYFGDEEIPEMGTPQVTVGPRP